MPMTNEWLVCCPAPATIGRGSCSAGGITGAISVFTVDHGSQVVEGTIDVARQIVKIGSDVYRAIPPEAFLIAGDPLQGLLKHESEDELIWIGEVGANVALFSGLSW